MSAAETNKKNYSDAIAYLYGLQKFGIKLGLDNTVRLLSLLGNPQNSFKAIHIAGTNGKGSTSAMITSILKTAGFRVGHFTSPHLVSFTERIRVNHVEIEEKEVVGLTEEIRETLNSRQPSAISDQKKNSKLKTQNSFLPTFFEFVTAMAFLYFKRKGVEWAVIETGMGGRLDATNVIMPLVSIITNISMDHKEFLGNTLREIASEKAGIIKEGIPVICSTQKPEAMEIIANKTNEGKSPLFIYGKHFVSHSENLDMQGITFNYEGKQRLNNLHVPLAGIHQVENASAAIRAIETIMEQEHISYGSVREGLAITEWHGRLELIKGDNYDFLIDGAHNSAASEALAGALERYFIASYARVIMILGIMADKDIGGIMKPLLHLASEIIFTAPDYERASSPEELAGFAGALGFLSTVVHSIKEAIDLALERAEKDRGKTLIVITGSFYTIGEAMICIGKECSSPSLTGLR